MGLSGRIKLTVVFGVFVKYACATTPAPSVVNVGIQLCKTIEAKNG
jgi:hypothetical protein